MSAVSTPIREVSDVDASQVFETVAGETAPVVFRGLVSDWPLVNKSQESNGEASRYLLEFYKDASVTAFVSESDIGGRIFYSDDLAETNFKQIKTGLDWVLEQLREYEDDPAPPTVYMGSMALDYCLPGLREQNCLPLGDIKATVRIWIGNRTTVAAHYDVLENIACVCAGRRRFTLFPSGANRQSVCWSDRFYAGRPVDQPGRSERTGLREVPALCRSAGTRAERRAGAG